MFIAQIDERLDEKKQLYKTGLEMLGDRAFNTH